MTPEYLKQRDEAARAYCDNISDKRNMQSILEAFKIGSDHEHERAKGEIASLEHSYRDLAKEIDRLTERARLSHETAKINHEEVMRLTAELEQAQQGMVRLDAELASQKKHYERMFDEQFFEQRTLNDKLTAENAELREANSIAAEYVHRVEVAEKERDELRARLDEITSYMPKVPTEPYEKRLAKEHSAALEVKLEK